MSKVEMNDELSASTSMKYMYKEGKSCLSLSLTWSLTVNTEVVALCIADRLQSHCFTLAVLASLWKRNTKIKSFSEKAVVNNHCNVVK